MAKFKIGDKVIVARHGQKGNIVSGPHDYGGSLVVYGIDLDNGKHTQETEGRIKAANSASVAMVGANSAQASTNAVVANALTWMDARSGKVATNTIGDCFADAVFHIERAARLVGQKPNSVKSELERAKQIIVGPYGVIKYDPDDRSLKATATRCATAIDKAIADPNVETITAARWACERERAKADGGSPRRTFWSNSAAVTNAFYKTEAEAEYRSGVFVDAAGNRIKGCIDNEIKTVNDCIKLFKGAPMSDKAKENLERLNAHLQKLKRCKAMF